MLAYKLPDAFLILREKTFGQLALHTDFWPSLTPDWLEILDTILNTFSKLPPLLLHFYFFFITHTLKSSTSSLSLCISKWMWCPGLMGTMGHYVELIPSLLQSRDNLGHQRKTRNQAHGAALLLTIQASPFICLPPDTYCFKWADHWENSHLTTGYGEGSKDLAVVEQARFA